jgi:hypothetical protein
MVGRYENQKIASTKIRTPSGVRSLRLRRSGLAEEKTRPNASRLVTYLTLGSHPADAGSPNCTQGVWRPVMTNLSSLDHRQLPCDLRGCIAESAAVSPFTVLLGVLFGLSVASTVCTLMHA